MQKGLGLLLVLALFSISVSAQKLYFPEKNKKWEEKAPEDLQMDSDKLKKALDFAMENEYAGSRDLRVAILEGFSREPYHKIAGPTKKRGGPAGLILKEGYIVAQWGDVKRVDMTFSVTKSYLSTLAGLALDQGLIQSVNDKVINYVWDGNFQGEHNAKITWHHLLTQSSDWSGSLFGMKDWADRPPREGGVDDWKYRELNKPGTVFEYNDVRVNVLAYSLLQVWREPLPLILRDQIMDPIGASSTWRWYGYENSWIDIDGMKIQSVSGGGHSGGGLFISSIDHAKFGLLFLRDGNWNGKQLISKNWIDQLGKSSEANASYGYMWWLNKGNRRFEEMPESVFYASGFGGNYIMVDKEHELVIVTRWLNPPKLGEFLKLVMESVNQ
ncbi:MAG: serine hydrolase [Bacteroidota bacterium]|nr:serine hydrolase [Bacteroidota bacterium]